MMITKKGRIKIKKIELAKIGDGKDLTKAHSTVVTLAKF